MRGLPLRHVGGATSRSTGLLPVLRKPEQAKYLEGNQTATIQVGPAQKCDFYMLLTKKIILYADDDA